MAHSNLVFHTIHGLYIRRFDLEEGRQFVMWVCVGGGGGGGGGGVGGREGGSEINKYIIIKICY